jgi:hypothetical protein
MPIEDAIFSMPEEPPRRRRRPLTREQTGGLVRTAIALAAVPVYFLAPAGYDQTYGEGARLTAEATSSISRKYMDVDSEKLRISKKQVAVYEARPYEKDREIPASVQTAYSYLDTKAQYDRALRSAKIGNGAADREEQNDGAIETGRTIAAGEMAGFFVGTLFHLGSNRRRRLR